MKFVNWIVSLRGYFRVLILFALIHRHHACFTKLSACIVIGLRAMLGIKLGIEISETDKITLSALCLLGWELYCKKFKF